MFGFASGDESWEVSNNTSDRVLWKNADYSGDDWQNDFEARYPEENTDVDNLAALADWLVSTDQSKATGNSITAVTYNGVSYDKDTTDYRLAKFKAEFSDHFEKEAVLFYYLFTELFLMVDSRAKNMFPTFMSGSKWFSLPYDFDTAIGINNEGALTFSYNLEDIDQTSGGADVFNGQQSVLWINVRAAFFDEIKAMYQSLRSTGALSYGDTESRFETHQGKWPEAIFNEDAYYKYLAPLIDDNSAAYLSMLQGSKAEQRKWWLYNRFRYMDSKYNAGDSLSDVITLRGYAKDDITVIPYADVYTSIKFGSYLVQKRAERNKSYTMECPLDNVNDTEIYIYSASQLKSVGDLSGLMVGYAEFSLATKLQELKIGDSSSSYSNGNLTELYLGNNTLLKKIDVRNCPNLVQSVDLSGCSGIEEIYFEGTGITGLQLPNGGVLKKLHLPATVTNLTIRNQKSLTDFSIAGFSNISTLRLENNGNGIDPVTLVKNIPAEARVRLLGVSLEFDSTDEIYEFYDLLDTMRGLDENGNNMDQAQVQGSLFIDTILGSDYSALIARYPDIKIRYNHISSVVYFYDYNGTALKTATSVDGAAVSYGSNPTRSSTAQYTFAFAGWSTQQNGSVEEDALTNITGDKKLYAVYTATIRSYTITFVNSTSGTTKTLQKKTLAYGSTPTYTGSTPTYAGSDASDWGAFNGWSPALTIVTGNQTYSAQFIDLRSVTRLLLMGKLTELEDDSITGSFYNDYKLKNVYVPKLKTLGNSLFNSCSSLKELDLPSATYLGTQIFSGCGSLKALILRNTEGCCEYKESGSTYDPPNANLKIYVPSALLESYKTATNWSRLEDKFVALEDYTVDGTTTGAMNKDSDGNIIART